MGRSYYTITEVTDLGPYVTKLVLPLKAAVKAEAVAPAGFSVHVERKDKRGDVLMLPKSFAEWDVKAASRGYCVVQDAYPSCLNGERREEGDCVTLELKKQPFGITSRIAAPNGMNEFVFCDYRITQIADIPAAETTLTGLVFDRCAGDTMRQTERFLHGLSAGEEESLPYGYFIPQTGGGRKPLIIWLHGGGEGGQDPAVAYAGNKVVNLASEEIQAKFGGALLLIPQAPTFWMNDGSGQYGKSGKSIYGKALKALIDEFIANNETAIDLKRIYIGGCSNGGFMTMRMVLDYPELFAAAFPICEALYDEVIADKEIEAIRHVPIWFTHAKDDLVVKPEETAVPTYERLKKAGAPNVHLSLFERVVDLHGLFAEENEEPYRYNGHFSWIYALNDDCRLDADGEPVVEDGKEVSLMDWLALRKK